MAQVPDLRSKEQIAGDFIDALRARLRKDIDLNDSSNLLQLIEATAQGLFKAEANVITMIDAQSVDRAQGEQLQRIATDRNVPILPALASTGRVNITDTSFTKVSTRIYAGQPAPVAGSLKLYVADASKFNTSGGQIYVGRGTTNVEGPLTYTSVQTEAGGSYWSITLAGTSPTTKFHNLGEEVTMAQGGNRLIQSNITVQTAQGASITAVSFVTTSAATIIDGETTVTDVPVRCNVPGTIGNVARGAITEIVSAPFPGTVFNSIGFSNGREADTDDDIKARIKAYEQAKAKGTETAIITASQNVVAKDELKKVQSANIVRFADNSTQLVFDDGSGYEPLFAGAPYETVVDSAVGGELEVQLRNRPIAQARTISTLEAPYSISDLSFLAVEVDGVETVHQFQASEFKVPSSATSFEIQASINGNSNLNFLCSTASNGSKLVLYPKNRSSNNIKVKVPSTGIDANDAIGFGLSEAVTIRLYKNDLPLKQDGKVASVSTRIKSSWSPAIASGDTLIYKVDKTPAVTATFNLTDFQAVDPSATVSYLTSIDTWAKVMNNLMPGVVASVVGDVIVLKSARGNDDSAAIEIVGGNLRNEIFDTTADLFSTGQAPDFTFNKETGQIGFAEALLPGDRVTAGSQYTRGSALTAAIPNGPTAAGRVWLLTDGAALAVPNGLKSNTSVEFSKTGSLLTITGLSPSLVPEGFEEAQEGDWIIVWANPSDPAPLQSNQGFWRIQSVQTGTVVVDDGATVRSNLNIGFNPTTDRIVIVRSQAPMQLLSFNANPLVTFINDVQDKLEGVSAEIVGSSVRIGTRTFSDDGEIFFAAADQGGDALDLPIGSAITNVPAHYGFVSETDAEAGMPSFTHGALGIMNTDSEFALANFEELKGEDDDFVQILDKYDDTDDAVAAIVESNKQRRSYVYDYDASLNRLYMIPPLYMRIGQSLMQQDDRFFFRQSYKFSSSDTTTAIIDGDSQTKSFTMPVARRLTVSNNSAPSTQDFSANDAESTLDMDDPASFYDFDFSNFRIHRQARRKLTDGVYEILFKNFDFGPSGNRVRVGFVYPDSATQDTLSHRFDVSEVIDAKIFLPAGTPRTPNWDYTTAFTVSKTTVGGKDVITYTYRSGTQPDFSNTGADVHVGDIAFISATSDFLSSNAGIKGRVISVSPLSFSIEVPTGASVADSVTFSNMLNQSGMITVTTSTPHGLSSGQRIGMWNTASPDGGLTYPFNTTYVVSVVNPTQFTVSTPVAVPGGTIQSAIKVSNIVTVNTSSAHNLIAGDVIVVTGAGLAYDGTATVLATPAANQFTYVRSGSAPAVSTGRFDFQSFSATTPVSITTAVLTTSTVTVNTSGAHGLVANDVVEVAGVSLAAYSALTNYDTNDLVSYAGQNYISLSAANIGNTPSSSPTKWAVTTLDLGGKFVVASTPTPTSFTYTYQITVGTSHTSGTGGTSTEHVPTGAMARALSGQTDENLQFAPVSTTAQEVVDYVSTNLSDKMTASVTNGAPTATITRSTEDIDLPSNYISTTVTGLYTFVTSRRAKLRTAVSVPKGSRVVLAGMGGAAAGYNGEYIILDTYLDTGLGFIVSEIQLPTLATATQSLTPGGTCKGSTPMLMLEDGDNSVQSSDLSALIALPMFTAKKQWSNAPDIGEEIRLVAVNSEQLHRFWNKLVVTGFTNVGIVELSRYGRDLQLSTQTFGGSGSVQISGGTANSVELSVISSGQIINSKLGAVSVPYAVRKGLIKGQWALMQNTVRQNKLLQMDATTEIRLPASGDGAEILSGSGTFQTVRSITHTMDTEIKVERHGNFVAIVGIGGPSMNLITNGVKEGDWVRISNVTEGAWSTITSYSIGNRVSYGGLNYTSLQNLNTNNQPDISPSYWQVQEFDKANNGVFQVVRIFGEDSFWIEHSDAVEEVITLGNPNSMKFYDHESVMPGDTLVITTDILGAANVGRYTVVDESYGVGYSFPTPTRIYTTQIPNPGNIGIVLGGEFVQFNVEEADPTRLWKKIAAVGPGSGTVATVIVDSPELIEKISSSLGAQVVGMGKLGFGDSVYYGLDAYKYYQGLIKELNKVIYGDPSDKINYPGVRAAGTAIGIKEAILRRVTAAFSVRLKSGVPFSEIRERVKSAIAGYVNGLGVGESVSISRMISAANTVPGVVSVAVTSPSYSSSSDLIAVAANEKAFVVDPTVDITVTLI